MACAGRRAVSDHSVGWEAPDMRRAILLSNVIVRAGAVSITVCGGGRVSVTATLHRCCVGLQDGQQLEVGCGQEWELEQHDGHRNDLRAGEWVGLRVVHGFDRVLFKVVTSRT
jgi:hypothetical protein